MKKGKIRIFGLLLLPFIMFGVDYGFAWFQKPPLFAIRKEIYKDGGTKLYQGLGYRVIDYNQLEGRDDVVFISSFVQIGKVD